jgi:glutamate--cysteine ligase
VTCADTSSACEDEPPISERDAERLIRAICFKTGPPGTIGAELEWLVRDRSDPSLTVPLSRIREVVQHLEGPGELPGAGLLTLEPGGQVELSTAPAKDLGDCIAAASGDLAVLHEAFGEAGLVLTGHGIDPLRRPSRVLQSPRYAAMEEYFDRDGHWGRLMMCSTASVQVCVDAGLDDDGVSGFPFRWRLLHAIGPVLVAAFANSPLRRGRPTGWKCTRQLVWARLDPSRTRSPGGAEPCWPGSPQAADGLDAREHWVRYAMDADVLCVRRPNGQPWTVPAGLTFRDWLRGADRQRPERQRRDRHGADRHRADRHRADRHRADRAGAERAGVDRPDADRPSAERRGEGRPRAPGEPPGDSSARPAGPTADDLSYHLSTLFPPVRPRGHLELRMIDAQDGDGWVVPVAVVAALADDPVAAAAAMAAAEPVWHAPGHMLRQHRGTRHAADGVLLAPARQTSRHRGAPAAGTSPWLRAARLGLADPVLARAALQCFEAAEASLARSSAPPAVRIALADFADRYVRRARCPADDALDAIGIQEGQS